MTVQVKNVDEKLYTNADVTIIRDLALVHAIEMSFKSKEWPPDVVSAYRKLLNNILEQSPRAGPQA